MSDKETVLELATDLVSAYVSHNQIDASELPGLVDAVFSAMLAAISEESETSSEKPVPAVPVEDSVTDDYIICLEDGQKYKSLKRHLRTKFELTPKAYRDKWGLPADYPMVAPNYSIERSRLAKRTGLGKS
jgi:predicted transcriptional regulator